MRNPLSGPRNEELHTNEFKISEVPTVIGKNPAEKKLEGKQSKVNIPNAEHLDDVVAVLAVAPDGMRCVMNIATESKVFVMKIDAKGTEARPAPKGKYKEIPEHCIVVLTDINREKPVFLSFTDSARLNIRINSEADSTLAGYFEEWKEATNIKPVVDTIVGN